MVVFKNCPTFFTKGVFRSAPGTFHPKKNYGCYSGDPKEKNSIDFVSIDRRSFLPHLKNGGAILEQKQGKVCRCLKVTQKM